MKIVVLGGTGMLGELVVEELRAADHDVVAASRSSGVDVLSRESLTAALEGADVVVDCLNLNTMSAKKAHDFFATAATNIAEVARSAGARQVVVASIYGATDEDVNQRHGYYRGKAAQEEAYRLSSVPVCMVHSTQWFELIGTMMKHVSLGPVAFLPTMKMAPIAAKSAARVVAREAGSGVTDPREVTVYGPEVLTSAQVARRWIDVRGSVDGKRPRFVAEAPLMGRAIATGGLIPSKGEQDSVTLEEWLASDR